MAWGDDMTNLEGRTVTGLAIGEEESYLRIETDQGALYYEVEGGCCSESWFADIVGVKSLIGHTVLKAESVDMGEVTDPERTRQDEDEQYGIKIESTGGWTTIVYRNSSNGYYGGWLNRLDKEPELETGWTPIMEDWRA